MLSAVGPADVGPVVRGCDVYTEQVANLDLTLTRSPDTWTLPGPRTVVCGVSAPAGRGGTCRVSNCAGPNIVTPFRIIPAFYPFKDGIDKLDASIPGRRSRSLLHGAQNDDSIIELS